MEGVDPLRGAGRRLPRGQEHGHERLVDVLVLGERRMEKSVKGAVDVEA